MTNYKIHCSIRSLSLLRKDDNLFKLEVRNLYESMKRNVTQFFWSFLTLSTCLVNEIFFLFVIGNNSTCPSYAVVISLMMKCASYPINCGKLWVCNANLCNLNCNLSAFVSSSEMTMIAYSHIIQRKRFFTHMAVRGAIKFLPLVWREICHEYIGRNYRLYITTLDYRVLQQITLYIPYRGENEFQQRIVIWCTYPTLNTLCCWYV